MESSLEDSLEPSELSIPDLMDGDDMAENLSQPLTLSLGDEKDNLDDSLNDSMSEGTESEEPIVFSLEQSFGNSEEIDVPEFSSSEKEITEPVISSIQDIQPQEEVVLLVDDEEKVAINDYPPVVEEVHVDEVESVNIDTTEVYIDADSFNLDDNIDLPNLTDDEIQHSPQPDPDSQESPAKIVMEDNNDNVENELDSSALELPSDLEDEIMLDEKPESFEPSLSSGNELEESTQAVPDLILEDLPQEAFQNHINENQDKVLEDGVLDFAPVIEDQLLELSQEAPVEEVSDIDIPQDSLTEELSDFDLPQESSVEEVSDIDIPQDSLTEELSDIDLPQESSVEEVSDIDIPQDSLTEELSDIDLPQETPVEGLSDLEMPEESPVEEPSSQNTSHDSQVTNEISIQNTQNALSDADDEEIVLDTVNLSEKELLSNSDLPDEKDLEEMPVTYDSLGSSEEEEYVSLDDMDDDIELDMIDEAFKELQPPDAQATEEAGISQQPVTQDNALSDEGMDTAKSPEPSGQGVDSEKMDEIKEVLKYIDKLFGDLPTEKIKEFAQSEYYDKYNKLFDELGI